MLLNVYLLLQEFKLFLFSVPPTPNLHQQESFNVDTDTQDLKKAIHVKMELFASNQKIPQLLSHDFNQSKILCKLCIKRNKMLFSY